MWPTLLVHGDVRCFGCDESAVRSVVLQSVELQMEDVVVEPAVGTGQQGDVGGVDVAAAVRE